MNQLFSPTNQVITTPPPRSFTTAQGNTEVPLLTELKNAYLTWHNYFNDLPRLTRYTLGAKIDNLLIEILELILKAQYTKKESKLIILNEMSNKIDELKFFVTLLWEAKGINTNKYTQLSQKLIGIGKMSGKWLAFFKKATPPAEAGGE